MNFNLLYRGSLSSCNYDCRYCPFAKSHDGRLAREQDERSVNRFVSWVKEQSVKKAQLSILFTPWGEGLIRKWYQQAMIELSHMPHVNKVAIQTNFSCRSDWLTQANLDKLALWISYHPSEITFDAFIKKCTQLDMLGVRYSVGMVGLPDNFSAIKKLRNALPETTYLWINAFKETGFSYTAQQVEFLQSIDSEFLLNLADHESSGLHCLTGEDTFSIHASGDVTRCHFVDEVLGNIYENELMKLIARRPCPNNVCDCYIGYAHLPHLPVRNTMLDGLLERIPKNYCHKPAVNNKISMQF